MVTSSKDLEASAEKEGRTAVDMLQTWNILVEEKSDLHLVFYLASREMMRTRGHVQLHTHRCRCGNMAPVRVQGGQAARGVSSVAAPLAAASTLPCDSFTSTYFYIS